VSSPGAERTLALPQDLDRFGSLPLRVEYINALGAQMNQVRGTFRTDQLLSTGSIVLAHVYPGSCDWKTVEGHCRKYQPLAACHIEVPSGPSAMLPAPTRNNAAGRFALRVPCLSTWGLKLMKEDSYPHCVSQTFHCHMLALPWQALQLESYDKASGLTVWKLADVKANAPGKGRGMSKKQREARFEISLSSVSRIRVFVDF